MNPDVFKGVVSMSVCTSKSRTGFTGFTGFECVFIGVEACFKCSVVINRVINL